MSNKVDQFYSFKSNIYLYNNAHKTFGIIWIFRKTKVYLWITIYGVGEKWVLLWSCQGWALTYMNSLGLHELSDLYSKWALGLTVPWLEDSNSMVPAFWWASSGSITTLQKNRKGNGHLQKGPSIQGAWLWNNPFQGQMLSSARPALILSFGLVPDIVTAH